MTTQFSVFKVFNRESFYIRILSKIFIFFFSILLISSLPSAYSAHQIQLTWDESVDIDVSGYRLFSRQEGEVYDYQTPVHDGQEIIFNADVNADTNWYFVVRAYNAQTESDNSNEEVYQPDLFDLDDDGLTDSEEANVFGTDLHDSDTDKDGVSDGAEALYWGSNWNVDYDSDGLNNLMDNDADNDGFLDGQEISQGSDPSNAASTPAAFSTHEIQLVWDGSDDPNVSGYRVFSRQEGAEYDYNNPVYDGQENLCDVEVNVATNWYFVVRAYADQLESENSNEEVYQPAVFDLDDDGLTDSEEVNVFGTDLHDSDTDKDGISDGAEALYWGSNWNVDYDSDGLNNLLDYDSDNDGFSDGQEILHDSDPANPAITPDSYTLPSDEEYGKIKGGDQSHVNEVIYSFEGIPGDVALYYEAWDVDLSDEVQILINGEEIGFAPRTGNETWGGLQYITLPDSVVYDSADNYIVFNNTYNPPNAYWWGVRLVSVKEGPGGYPLPYEAAYGRIRGGDQSHVNEVNYTFEGMSGDVALYYEVWDVDFRSEVSVLLNGVEIGYAPTSGDEIWGGVQCVRLPANLVNDSSDNHLAFSNTKNPPNSYWWGVRSVFVGDEICSYTLPSSDAYGKIMGGDQSHINEVSYSFEGIPGDVMLHYEVWDVDLNDEVQILLNGVGIDFAPRTSNESWGGGQYVTLPDSAVNDSSINYLTFDNIYNPSYTYWWGVRAVSIE
jgi:Bacterial TSP3 repeat